MKNTFIALSLTLLSGFSTAGEMTWNMIRFKDASNQSISNVLCQVETDELKKVVATNTPTEFLHMKSILVMESNGMIRKPPENPNFRTFNREIYIKTSNIIDIGPVNPAMKTELDNINKD